MILQGMFLPSSDICSEERLYINGTKAVSGSGRIVIEKDGMFETNTYFNAFSIKKWKMYTKVEKLLLRIDAEGICDISLCYAWIDGGNSIRLKGDNIVSYNKTDSERETISLQYPECPQGVIAYFKVVSHSDKTTVYNAFYEADIDETELKDVKIAVGICTYKREEFITRNMKTICNGIINNKVSCLYGKLDVYISDNGQTLDVDMDEHITVYPNKNLGGSGGFTRCMIEVKKNQESKGYTHIILMDDDILLDPGVLERNYTFLQLQKDEYRDAMIGGNMLVLDTQYKQFENAALYRKGKLEFRNNNVDLRTFRNVIQNEILYDRNYNAWCYCCMPLNKIHMDNLPLPLFIHMDDVEYGVRNRFEVITLNGIGVWHPYFSNQRGASIVYYDVRNKLIVLSELGGRLIDEYALEYLDIFHRSLFNYDYERTLAACKAIEDFCNGIDDFKNMDPIKRNGELSVYNKPWEDADEQLKAQINNSQSISYMSRWGLIKNYILPSTRKEIVVDCNIADVYPYRAQQVTLMNRLTGKKCVYKKSLWKMLACKRACKHAKKRIKKDAFRASIEWKERLNELTNIDFWNNYLEL